MAEGITARPGADLDSSPASSAPLESMTSAAEALPSTDSQKTLRWLASFPELNSNPVTEIDVQTGAAVYVNPAGRALFPDLPAKGLQHPWAIGLKEVAKQLHAGREKSIRREVQVGDRFYDQTVTCPMGRSRLRIYGIDITRRKQIERQLEQARLEAEQAANRLATLMEMLPVGVALADFASNQIRTNAMFHRIWGRPVPEKATALIPESCAAWSAETGAPLPLSKWASASGVSSGEPVLGQLMRIRRVDGAQAFVLNSSAPILGPEGRVIGHAIALMDITERVEAEHALRQSREDLNYAQAVARTGSWRLDLKQNQLLWSDETYRIFGIPLGTPLTYQTFLDAVHPEDRAFVDAQWQAALNGAPYDCEHRIAGSGSVKWVRERAVLEFGPDGSLIGAFGTAQDITEKKEAEQALLRAKTEWERTFDAVPDLIAIVDAEHRIQRVNRAMAERLNLSADDCVGKHCYKLVHGSDCPPGFCPHKQTMADGLEYAVEVKEDRLGGHFLVSTTALTDETGKRIGSVHVARDITGRVLAERMLAESEQRYRGLVDLSPDALLVLKEDRVAFLNPAGVALFGASRAEELLGKNLFDLLAEEDRSRFAEPLWRIQEGSAKQVSAFTCTILGLDSRRREAEASAVAIPYEGAPALQVVFRDMTERNQVQTRLRESQQRLAQAMFLGRCFAFEWNPETDLITRASECQQILGLAGDEATRDTGQNYFRRVHPEDREVFIEALQGLAPGAETYRAKYRVLRGDGEVVTLEETARATFNADGRMTRLIGIAFDVTERERNQAALRQSEQRYALAQRAASIASWEWDLQSDSILWSDHIDQLLGFKPGEFGRTLSAFLDCVHPEDRARVETALREAAKGGSAYDVEHRIVRRDGSIRWVSGVAEVYENPAGAPARMVGILGDITRRKLAEQARADYLARVSTLVQVSRDILGEESPDGLLKLAAMAAEKLTGGRQVFCAPRNYRAGSFEVAVQRHSGEEIPEATGRMVALAPGDSFRDWLQSPDTAVLHLKGLPLLPKWWRPSKNGAAPGALLGAKITARDGSSTGFLLVADKANGGFTHEDEALLAQLAALVSVGQQRIEAKQEALRRARELQAVFSAMAEMVVVYDCTGMPVSANPATTKLFGFNPVGCTVETLISRLSIRHPNGRRFRVHEMPCQRALKGEAVRNMRMALTAAGGMNYIVLASASPFMDGRQVLGAVCVWHDVTERERLLNELEVRVQERTSGLRETVRHLEEEVKERQRAERALAESEEQYRTLFEHAPIGIVMTDFAGNVHAANQAATSLFGWSRQDFLGLKAQRLYADRSERTRLIREVRANGRAERLDLQLRQIDGGALHVAIQVNKVELRGKDMMMVLVQDLTQQKEAQKRDVGVRKLLELFATQSTQQGYLSAVVEFLREWCDCRCVGIRLQDASGRMPYVTRVGFSHGFVRLEEQWCVGALDCACIRALHCQTLAMERQYTTPHGSFICNRMSRWINRIKGGKGKELPCAVAKFESVAHVPIRVHGEVRGAIHLADRRGNRFPAPVASFVEAISPLIGEALHRFAVEAELREREQRLRSMFEHHEAIMLLVEAGTGVIKDANSAAGRFYGRSEEQLRGIRIDELNAFPVSSGQSRPFEQWPVYVQAQRLASGETRTVEVHSSPVQVGAERAYFCIIHDITERKRLEQRILEVGDKERQSIGRDLHDTLGGHLTGIALITKGLAQSLREQKCADSAIAEELVEAVNQAVAQSKSISRGVCPVGLGRFGLAIGLQEYAVNASKLFRLPFRFNTRGDVTVPDEQVATHMYRIAQEAVTNAVRHGRPKRILIRLEGRANEVVLSVKDDGVGFAGPVAEGAGMGMRTMQYRADLIGARLTFTSAPGKGTLVSCFLPRQRQAVS